MCGTPFSSPTLPIDHDQRRLADDHRLLGILRFRHLELRFCPLAWALHNFDCWQ